MADFHISPEQALTIAATVLRAPAGGAVTVDAVERLDGANPYYLVVFGDAGELGAIVVVDSVHGQISSSAHLQRVQRPWVLDKALAVAIAKCQEAPSARLVWKPSRVSLSPFYPVWEIGCNAGVVYIDRGGKVWRELAPAGPG